MTHPWTLIYDGQCGFCRRWVGTVRRWDRRARVRSVPFQDGAAWQGMPGLELGALEQAVHLVAPEGRVYAGAAAARPLLALLPGGRVLAAPLALPGAERLARAVYRWVARRRHRDGCTSPGCRRGD
jgi:predicted DCC family thiol-disulfide oxidoreductase YuxK